MLQILIAAVVSFVVTPDMNILRTQVGDTLDPCTKCYTDSLYSYYIPSPGEVGLVNYNRVFLTEKEAIERAKELRLYEIEQLERPIIIRDDVDWDMYRQIDWIN